MPVPTTCPACGSPNVETKKSTESFDTPYGPSFNVELRTHRCESCGESGDFDKSNDEIIRGAIRQSERDGMKSMLKNLAEKGIMQPYIERALGLEGVTTSKEMAALLRIITTYPWVLRVADARYASGESFKALVIEAGKAILRRLSSFRDRA